MENERTPLLGKPASTSSIPYGQLALLGYARWIHGWFFYTIFPYISQMIEDTGVPVEHVGYYAGLMESAYSVVELVTMLWLWTEVSDKWGRRPVMLICLACLTVAGTMFGFSTKIWQMVFWRGLAGAFSGCLGAMRVMLSEMSTEDTEPKMLSIWACCENIGILIAPIAGGLLARPTEHFDWFEGWALFEDYPYLLPSLLMGVMGSTCTLFCFFWLKETLETSCEGEDGTNHSQLSYLSLAQLPGVPYVLSNTLVMQILIFAWTAIEPVYCFTHTRLGGLDFSVKEIAGVMSAVALMQAILMIGCFAPLEARIRLRGCLFISGVTAFIAALLSILANALRREAYTRSFRAVFAGSLIAASFHGALGQSANQIMVNNMAPTAAVLGKLSSLSLSIIMAGRSIAPTAATSLYALGVSHNIFKGQLGWTAVSALGVAYAVSLVWYPKGADSRRRPSAMG